MSDQKYEVNYYISVFSEKTETLEYQVELCDFDLSQFQDEFGITDKQNPMFDSYEVKSENVTFINKYVSEQIAWDFKKYSYFVETINANPEWITRGKTIKQLIEELQTFEDQNLEVKISTDDGETYKCISLVGKRFDKNKTICTLINCE